MLKLEPEDRFRFFFDSGRSWPNMLPPSGPDWMSELPEELWDVPLTDLAIPGRNLEALRKSGGVIMTDCVFVFVFSLVFFGVCFDRRDVAVNLRDKDVKMLRCTFTSLMTI